MDYLLTALFVATVAYVVTIMKVQDIDAQLEFKRKANEKQNRRALYTTKVIFIPEQRFNYTRRRSL